jgi:hypothetical protein
MKFLTIIMNVIFLFSIATFVGCATSSSEKRAVSKSEIVTQVEGALAQHYAQHKEYPKTLSQLQLSANQEHLKSHLNNLKYKSYKWGKSAGYDLEGVSHTSDATH